MDIREASIKCKYCGHFEPGLNRCHLSYNYDRYMHTPGVPYLQETDPNGRCSSFSLSPTESLVKEHGSKRADGTLFIELSNVPGLKEKLVKEEKRAQRGCYIATAVYGSYDCPQVWTLRRFRDYTLSRTAFGKAFIRFYYSVSPVLVRAFGETNTFQKFWKRLLDKFVTHLKRKGVQDTPYDDPTYQ